MIIVELPQCRAVPPFVRRIAQRHREFDESLTWNDALRVCARERIAVRVRQLPAGERGRMIRTGEALSIHVSRTLPPVDRLISLVHELGHHFAGDVDETCIVYDDDGLWSAAEEFCDLFAWYCCDQGAREFLDRREIED